MNEFQVIKQFFKPLTKNHPFALNLTDDSAVISSNQQIVITTDTLAENTHFISGACPKTLAKKLIRVNISDLAAMGAIPKFYFLSLTLSSYIEENWLMQFAAGLSEDNSLFNLVLLGGNTVKHNAPLVLTLTAIGEILKQHQPITRNHAIAGDNIYVTGTIGDAALGLLAKQQKLKSSSQYLNYLIERYDLPQPRISIGSSLIGIATAMLDISDGLAQDAEHIACNSQVKLTINTSLVPLSQAASKIVKQNSQLMSTVLSGGDDYELLFTAPENYDYKIQEISQKNMLQITKIGKVTTGQGVILINNDKKLIELLSKGYLHL